MDPCAIEYVPASIRSNNNPCPFPGRNGQPLELRLRNNRMRAAVVSNTPSDLHAQRACKYSVLALLTGAWIN
eukprot:scaffold346_cov387-Prasinococcus_capsulatus_cf.AAC.25